MRFKTQGELLRGLIAQLEGVRDDSEGHYPRPDTGCFDCTAGTVPDSLNRGKCAYHQAQLTLIDERVGITRGLLEDKWKLVFEWLERDMKALHESPLAGVDPMHVSNLLGRLQGSLFALREVLKVIRVGEKLEKEVRL